MSKATALFLALVALGVVVWVGVLGGSLVVLAVIAVTSGVLIFGATRGL